MNLSGKPLSAVTAEALAEGLVDDVVVEVADPNDPVLLDMLRAKSLAQRVFADSWEIHVIAVYDRIVRERRARPPAPLPTGYKARSSQRADECEVCGRKCSPGSLKCLECRWGRSR